MLRDTNQTITKLDEDTVVIENDFGAKAISMDRLIEITWPGEDDPDAYQVGYCRRTVGPREIVSLHLDNTPFARKRLFRTALVLWRSRVTSYFRPETKARRRTRSSHASFRFLAERPTFARRSPEAFSGGGP